MDLLPILLLFRKTIRHEEPRKETVCQKGKIRKLLVSLSESWFFKEDHCNDKSAIRLPWEDLSQERHTKLCNAIPLFAR